MAEKQGRPALERAGLRMKQAILFYFFSALTLLSALLVVRLRNIFHAALFLILAFVGVAGIYLTLNAEFLAGGQVLIYVGAIAVLILFAIMLTRRVYDQDSSAFNGQQITAGVLIALLFLLLASVLFGTEWPEAADGEVLLPALAAALLKDYALPFELVSAVLLAACIGAVLLARKEEG